MKPLLILYATREGQTRLIADHLAELIRKRGLSVELQDAKTIQEPFALNRFGAAILAASIHVGQHESEMIAFVKRHRTELDSLPSAFLSISLTEAGVEMPTADPARRAQAIADVEKMFHTFYEQTGWHPARVSPVAGALLYSKYGLLLRWIMKQIAKRAGGDTDTSHDHVYTDWERLDLFVTDFLNTLPTDA